MISREEYLNFVESFNAQSETNNSNRNKKDQRFGQHFINYLSINKGIKNLVDSELFYKEDRKICEQIIEQRYLHPSE